jgi:hypothetical protein
MPDNNDHESAPSLEAIAVECLGRAGRLLSASKSGYLKAHPDHLVAFNANVCVNSDKVWWGDLDLTLSEQALRALASRSSGTVSLVGEHEGRFEQEARPLVERALYSVTPNGYIRLGNLWEFSYRRDADGQLYRVLPPPARVRRPRRPGLWRFWRRERRSWQTRRLHGPDWMHEVVLGSPGQLGAAQDGQRSDRYPFLVLGFGRSIRRFDNAVVAASRITWYPTTGYCWLPGFRLKPHWRIGRSELRLFWIVQPGLIWELAADWTRLRQEHDDEPE